LDLLNAFSNEKSPPMIVIPKRVIIERNKSRKTRGIFTLEKLG
jgi:hypothetical protein